MAKPISVKRYDMAKPISVKRYCSFCAGKNELTINHFMGHRHKQAMKKIKNDIENYYYGNRDDYWQDDFLKFKDFH